MKKECTKSIIGTVKYLAIATAIVSCSSLSGVAADVEENDNNVNNGYIEIEQTSKGSTPEEREAILNKFNKEHGTNYQIATKEQAERIGQDAEEQEKEFNSMSSEKFEEYLTEIYENEQGILNDKQKFELENPVFMEPYNADETITKEAERVYGDEEDVELLNKRQCN